MPRLPTRNDLLRDADLCVKCGVCLPHCPTFALHHEETESPRGRISLVQGLASGQLPATAKVIASLDHCLSCGRCESACPAKVPYARLMDGARFVLQTTPPASLGRRRLTARLLTSPRLLRLLARLADVARKTGLYKLFGRTSGAGRALAWMPPAISMRRRTAPVRNSSLKQAQAIIFPGCITSAFEQDIVDSAVRIGSRLGIIWHEPQETLCCAGLYQHLGQHAASQSLMTTAVQSLAAHAGLPIATVLSGCGKSLSENLGFAATTQATDVARRLVDIHTLLVQFLDNIPQPVFVQAQAPVAVYLPCSLTARQRDNLVRLLNQVPNARVQELDRGFGCCGAAGDNMTTYPESADALVAVLIKQARELGVAEVLIPNLGCTWHWRANLRKHNVNIAVRHPLQWLNAHLQSPDQQRPDAIISS